MGAKVGLDDFLAQKNVGDLLALAWDELTSESLLNSWVFVDPWPVLHSDLADDGPTLWLRTDGPALLYPGRLHAFVGEPESCKGWAALHACVQVISANGHVLYVDFETDARSVFARIRSLGVADDVIAERFHYCSPEGPLTDAAWAELEASLSPTPLLVILDGVTEAMQLHGLKVEDNTDTAKFLHLLPNRLKRLGSAVAMIDHVTKARKDRGRWAIGANTNSLPLTSPIHSAWSSRSGAAEKEPSGST